MSVYKQIMTSVLLLLMCIVECNVFGQQPDMLLKKLDSLNSIKVEERQTNNIYLSSYTEDTRITFPNYFVLLGSDLKQELVAPFHQTSKQLLQSGIYVGTIITLQSFSEEFDEPIQKFAVRFNNSSAAVSNVSSYVTKFGDNYELYSLAALGGYGFIFNNKKMQTATLLATQAYITSAIIETGIKYITGRQRPSYTASNVEAEPIFHGPKFIGNKKIDASFPSGHTTVAFAAATVFAKEYKNIQWVPIAAYSAATLVGLSRIVGNDHWATDIIVGATLGYLCGKGVVNNYHRYAIIKSGMKKNSVSFNINYTGHNFEPGIIYRFR